MTVIGFWDIDFRVQGILLKNYTKEAQPPVLLMI